MAKKTVRVRIAVCVDHTGDWSGSGFKSANPDELHSWNIDNLELGEARYWLEADLEIPEVATVQADVTEADAGES